MSTPLPTILAAALDAARKALRDLEADQVPNDLRRVAGASGSLPRPLAVTLLKGLEQYEWLREKAAEHLDPEAVGDRVAAARVFLDRAEGWGTRLAEITAAAAGVEAEQARRSAESRESELKADLRAAREKVKTVKREQRARASAAEKKAATLASRLKAEAAGEARGEREASQEVAALRAEIGRLESALEEANRATHRAKAELRDERASRRKAEAAAAGGAETPVWADEPEALAERMDELASMARPPARVADAASEPETPGGLRLPKGVHPDAGKAIEWLVGLASPVTVIVDGYNVGYNMQGEHAPGPARTRVAPVLQHLHRMAQGPLRVVVVYDSNIGPAESPPAPGPVVVRYSRDDETADDEVVRLSGRLDGPVVVISDDRAVRDRSEARGALPLWSRALIDWAATR